MPLGDVARDDEEIPLPRPLPAMWRLCRLGFRSEPRLMGMALALSILAAVPDGVLALWFKLLASGVLDDDRGRVRLALLGLAVSAALTWVLGTLSQRLQRRFRDRVTIALEAHVARLQATVATVSHQERPEHLDRLSVLRDQVFVLDHMYMSVFTTVGWLIRLVLTIALLVSVHPALALLTLFALPTVLTSSWRPGVERAVQERVAQAGRLAQHLSRIATTAPPGKEVRVAGIGQSLVTDRRAASERAYRPVAAVRWRTALWQVLGWATFGGAYVAAIVFVASGIDAPPGDVLLVLAAGARLSMYVGATVGEIGFLRGIWMDGAQRLAWLEDYAAAQVAAADLSVPTRIVEGIRFENVDFAYPGSDRLVLEGVDLLLPAGTVVAIVGENGAGKSTLVKLLSKLYEPTRGRILVDDIDLHRLEPDEWRARQSGAYQDFFKFELAAQHTVGVGDLPHLFDQPAVAGAVDRAGATDVVERLPQGLDTQLGPTWPGGVEVSFGQWQKLAVARGFMREEPLLLVLDEPTAALDAETEHALFERYAETVRRDRGAGRITVLVSHRFSTVRMADLIVVLDGSRVAEVGTHEALVARGGQYAELYAIQAAAYR
jgi:ATP-binding cassette subfamily B protein